MFVAGLLGQTLVACAGTGASTATTAVAPASHSASVQRIVDDEAARVRSEWGARRVAIVVLDPHTGAALAELDDAAEQPVVPASTFKTFTVALALDAGVITPEQRIDCGNGSRAYGDVSLHDVSSFGPLNAGEMLQVSTNVGISRIFDLLGAERFRDGMRRFQLDVPADLATDTVRSAIIVDGEGSTLTPLALTRAYGVLANDGLLALPGSAQPVRVVKESTARTLRSMLEGVVTGEQGSGKAAAVAGVRVGGKTGTSDPDPDCKACAKSAGMFANFVGIAPIDQPRWVVYVGVGQPSKEGTGGTIAAPAFSRVATRLLAL
jgi:cell division protein FtsI (penicillin-binding protein 3)